MGSAVKDWGRGLFIAKAIAVAHRGGIEVDSAHGQATFKLVLPRQAVQAKVAA
ncbi:MAG: hypothetical protein JWP65_507 [Ramlibacter sp.]|jgi:signal transduction histidine kinase|nr:hypothetical protein [Ramlibacter sp.]